MDEQTAQAEQQPYHRLLQQAKEAEEAEQAERKGKEERRPWGIEERWALECFYKIAESLGLGKGYGVFTERVKFVAKSLQALAGCIPLWGAGPDGEYNLKTL